MNVILLLSECVIKLNANKKGNRNNVIDFMLRMGLIYSYEHTHRLNIKGSAHMSTACGFF